MNSDSSDGGSAAQHPRETKGAAVSSTSRAFGGGDAQDRSKHRVDFENGAAANAGVGMPLVNGVAAAAPPMVLQRLLLDWLMGLPLLPHPMGLLLLPHPMGLFSLQWAMGQPMPGMELFTPGQLQRTDWELQLSSMLLPRG